MQHAVVTALNVFHKTSNRMVHLAVTMADVVIMVNARHCADMTKKIRVFVTQLRTHASGAVVKGMT
jgi:hypothetical protein